MRALAGSGMVVFALQALPRVLHAQQHIPVIDLPAALAKSMQTLGAVLGVRQVRGTKVLGNEAGRRQLKLFDSPLAAATIVLDSPAGGAASYGRRAAPLIPYLGDSSLFPDLN